MSKNAIAYTKLYPAIVETARKEITQNYRVGMFDVGVGPVIETVLSTPERRQFIAACRFTLQGRKGAEQRVVFVELLLEDGVLFSDLSSDSRDYIAHGSYDEVAADTE